VAGSLSPTATRATGGPDRAHPAVWLRVGPPRLVLTLRFLLPIGLVFVTSVTDPPLSLAHYQRIFTVPRYST
jgi:hypothetical protein